MKLRRRKPEEPPVEIRITIPAETVAELKAYGQYYEQTYSETIAMPVLVVEIVQHYLERERGFRRWTRDLGRRERPTPRESEPHAARTS
jgi:hypothetical protein